MPETIEHPKVFLSYAQGDAAYQELVLNLAIQLKKDGVEVIFDKWRLKPGTDMYAFMEKCVNDESVKKVLILIDPLYTQKADGREGGVGTETQIITPELYGKSEQNKFIPVLMERDESGKVLVPAYLKSRLYIDLSDDTNRSEQYQKIVRLIYEYDEYIEPPLGNKPKWLDKTSDMTYNDNIFSPYKSLPKKDSSQQKILMIGYLEKIKKDFLAQKPLTTKTTELYVQKYKKYFPFRDEFLTLLDNSIYGADNYKEIIEFLDDLRSEALQLPDFRRDILCTMLHEIFLYTVAVYLKFKQYDALTYLFNRQYGSTAGKTLVDTDFRFFYNFDECIDKYMSEGENKGKVAGLAAFWLKYFNNNTIISKDDFVSADVLCYNVSLFKEETFNKTVFYWFPLTYVFGGKYMLFRKITGMLKSKEESSIVAKMVGYDEWDTFKNKYQELYNGYLNGVFKGYSYRMTFTKSPSFFGIVMPDELAM